MAEGNLATLLNADQVIKPPLYCVKYYCLSSILTDFCVALQLLNQMEARQVFVGYKEGDITFPPTYKYDNGADLYDSR